MEIPDDHSRDKIRIVYRSQLNATWDGKKLDVIERRGSVCHVFIAADQVDCRNSTLSSVVQLLRKSVTGTAAGSPSSVAEEDERIKQLIDLEVQKYAELIARLALAAGKNLK